MNHDIYIVKSYWSSLKSEYPMFIRIESQNNEKIFASFLQRSQNHSGLGLFRYLTSWTADFWMSCFMISFQRRWFRDKGNLWGKDSLTDSGCLHDMLARSTWTLLLASLQSFPTRALSTIYWESRSSARSTAAVEVEMACGSRDGRW